MHEMARVNIIFFLPPSPRMLPSLQRVALSSAAAAAVAAASSGSTLFTSFPLRYAKMATRIPLDKVLLDCKAERDIFNICE